MKSLVMIFVGMLLVPVAVSKNIPVDTVGDVTKYVDPEELLEAALEYTLKHHNIKEVNVDKLDANSNYGYKIVIKSNGDLEPNFQNTFQNILRRDLGVSVITERAKRNWRYKHLYDDEIYFVYLDLESGPKELESLAQKTNRRTFLNLKNRRSSEGHAMSSVCRASARSWSVLLVVGILATLW